MCKKGFYFNCKTRIKKSKVLWFSASFVRISLFYHLKFPKIITRSPTMNIDRLLCWSLCETFDMLEVSLDFLLFYFHFFSLSILFLHSASFFRHHLFHFLILLYSLLLFWLHLFIFFIHRMLNYFKLNSLKLNYWHLVYECFTLHSVLHWLSKKSKNIGTINPKGVELYFSFHVRWRNYSEFRRMIRFSC